MALEVLPSLKGLKARQDLTSDMPRVEALCGTDPPSWFLGVSIMSPDLPWHKSYLLCCWNHKTKTRGLFWSCISEPEKLFFDRTRQRLRGSVIALGEHVNSAQKCSARQPPISITSVGLTGNLIGKLILLQVSHCTPQDRGAAQPQGPAQGWRHLAFFL